MRFSTIAAAALAVAELSACASRPAGPEQAAPEEARLFISPMGEAFRRREDGASGLATWFAQADSDRDGRLSRAEFFADATRFFHRLDANADGLVTSSEVTAFQFAATPELVGVEIGASDAREQQDAQDEAEPRPDGRRRHRLTTLRPAPDQESGDEARGKRRPYRLLNDGVEPVMSADYDLNGRVTMEEYILAAGRRFDRIDADRNGSFTLDEAPKPKSTRRR